jgi:cell division protein FtsN
LGVNPRQRTSEVQEQAGYWVYLSPMSYPEAQAVANNLERHNDKEYFIGKNNYISLGAYKDAEMAENRRAQISAMGYEPKLNPRFQTRTVYWLDFNEDQAKVLAPEEWKRIATEYRDVLHQALSCQ